LTFLLFKSFFDKGYIFSKIIGVTLGSYAIFVLGLMHLIPFSTVSSIMVFVAVAGIFFFILRHRQKISDIWKTHWKIFLGEEIIFGLALFFWAYIHGFSPDINGLEKFMDFGFINSILRADYFPPKDMWFTPLPINYYYFGHLITAVITKLSGLPSQITFNLMLSTIFALCFSQSFSIAANLFHSLGLQTTFKKMKLILAGLLGASLVTFAGNLHIIYAFFKAYPNEFPVPLWELLFQPALFPNGYWYPNATRFIHNTIHEFPMYSWTVADLHGHVLDIPVVLLIIAVLLSLFIKSQNSNNKSQKTVKDKTKNIKNFIKNLKLDIGYWTFIGFLLSVAYMTNAWDAGIYLLLTFLVLVGLSWNLKNNYKKIASAFIIVILSFIIFVFPFNIHFKPFVSGIGILCAPEFLTNIGKIGPFLFEANHCQHSPWWQLITLYGFFYFFIISFAIFLFRKRHATVADNFVLLMSLLATLLIVIPELIYVKDIYPDHYRANTMFKLVFQAFIMFSLASGYIMIRIVSSIKYKELNFKQKLLASCFLLLASSLIALVMLYPHQAINSYYGNLTKYQDLNGTNYLKNLYPSDYAAILWINDNIKGQPVILEAQGDSYTTYARVSTNTGLPTILGWTVHEWLWRGTYDIPAPRIEEIKILYESKTLQQTKALLKKYNVEYVFVGSLEREKYLNLYENKFDSLGKPVYQNGSTFIYKITPL
ncbi:MAG TPA: DUF2298 domain-containing protein, partial [Patescibacteria group bacterium]|nr:DUF2298 domain-containing protein [Patescibacteria group bacterium]